MQRVYKSDPLAHLLSLLSGIKAVPLMHQLMETVAQHHYGMTLNLVAKAFQLDATRGIRKEAC